MFSEASLHKEGASAEEALKLGAVFPLSRGQYDQNLYVESARRVVFRNCMEKCELEPTDVPNFNKNFYYNQPQASTCLTACFNHRMQAHFGKMATQVDGLQMDFDKMKAEYQRYEMWFPANQTAEKYMGGYQEDQVQGILNNLKDKTQKANSRFDF